MSPSLGVSVRSHDSITGTDTQATPASIGLTVRSHVSFNGTYTQAMPSSLGLRGKNNQSSLAKKPPTSLANSTLNVKNTFIEMFQYTSCHIYTLSCLQFYCMLKLIIKRQQNMTREHRKKHAEIINNQNMANSHVIIQ